MNNNVSYLNGEESMKTRNDFCNRTMISCLVKSMKLQCSNSQMTKKDISVMNYLSNEFVKDLITKRKKMRFRS